MKTRGKSYLLGHEPVQDRPNDTQLSLRESLCETRGTAVHGYNKFGLANSFYSPGMFLLKTQEKNLPPWPYTGVRAVWGPPGPHNARDMGTGGPQISSVIGTGGPRISGDMGIL